ncbi:zinc finger MYM-type protein 1-like [Diprion similis]|uniref:zinc finger MYM-type protein 1-like n=1 Tax=Diprion similis TaxID=362088 RepID=UPI001EF79A4E|nr:zinc finger MYM-type protein 1-like [Diprion similis]
MKNGESQPRCFRDWKNATARIESHENSLYHRTNVSSLKARGNVGTRLENTLIQQMNKEISYWRNVLRRVVAVVKYLAGRGLPFRGNIEQIGNPHNGNFLASMELIAQFDPFLAKHLQLNAHVDEILTETKLSKYFEISVDSTADIAHVDQLTLIIRYVTENGEPVERFIAFIANSGHKAEQLTDTVLNALRHNMSGSYTGLQTRIRKLNPLADYIPCAASTHRWEILLSHVNRVLKKLSATRWSARYDACYALHDEWTGVIEALECMAEDEQEKPKTRCEARGILSQLQQLETASLVALWTAILKRFNSVSRKLQEERIDLTTVLQLFSSLAEFLQDLRSCPDHFTYYENKGKSLCGLQNYAYDSRRRKTRKLQVDETREGDMQPDNGREHFRINVFNTIIDTLSAELQRRSQAYRQLQQKFNFLDHLLTLDSNEIATGAKDLVSKYPEDLEESLREECIHLSSLLKTILRDDNQNSITALQVCKILRKNGLREMYPNVDIALRIFLSMPATNCSGERLFSTLKRVKSYLRASMERERLNAVALLTIHAEKLQKIDCEEMIDQFAATKCSTLAQKPHGGTIPNPVATGLAVTNGWYRNLKGRNKEPKSFRRRLSPSDVTGVVRLGRGTRGSCTNATEIDGGILYQSRPIEFSSPLQHHSIIYTCRLY